MTWKPTLLAAVVVIAAGLGAGAVLGGSSDAPPAKTVTVAGATPDQTPTTTTPSVETPATETTPETNPAEPPPDSSDITRLDEDNTKFDEGISDPVFAESQQLQRGGEVAESLGFTLDTGLLDNETPDNWEMTLNVPDASTRFKSTLGFLKGALSGKTVRIDLYKDEVQGATLISQFRLAATEVKALDVDVTDVANLIVRIRPGEKFWNEENPGFGFLDARFE